MGEHSGNMLQIKDRHFRVSIPSERIQKEVAAIAGRMNKELAGKTPLFIAVLNGSFLFAADLFRNLDIECSITFVKLASYSGTSSTGNVKQLLGLNEDIKGRTVIVLEDIVDTGVTLESLYAQLGALQPAELKTAALLFKPHAYKKNIKVDYVGMEVGNEFLVGYGLDYDGLGRNLRDIYTEVT